MKKVLLLLASAALLIVGCNKELVQSSPEDAETVDVSFSAALDNTERLTRAVADNDGNAAKVNHWVMEVRDAHNDLFIRQEKDADEGVLEQTFSFKLFKNQTYSIQFWADTKGAYVTEDLTAISAVGSVANVDSRDAFSANVEGYKSEKSEAKSITLYRPFGQLNIITTDLKDMKSQVVASAYAKYVPVDLKVVASIPTTFNVQTQQAGSSTEQTLTAVTSYADFLAGAAKTTLFMDYIFASKDENDIVNFAFSFLSDGNEIAYDFTSIPMRRNYRTNIMGQLLSNDSQWTVTIAPAWNGEINPEYVVEGSVAAAIKAIKEGKTVIEISSPEDLDAPIALPVEADGKDISINITGVSDKELTFLPAEGAQGPANLFITTDAQDLVINCPKTHVEVNGGIYQSVEATTSATTLVVGKDVTIETLKILAGNVEIYGKVTTLNRANGVKANWYADSREKLIAGLDKSVAGESVVLTSDIDLNNVEWTPVTIGKAITFDGGNHTIKNLKIAETHPDSHYGFIGYLYSNGVVKNLTINGAEILLPESKGDNSRGAALVGIARDGDIINCHVKNVTVKAYQKVGGLIGQYSLEASGTSIVKDCSSENVTISENQTGEGVWGVGGLIGSLCFVNKNHGINVEGCSVKGISISNSTTAEAPKQTAHAFIGTIRDDAEGAVATLTGNTVGQTVGLYTDMYSSDYFGWATNPECESHQCKIIIDGVEWTPNYPIKNENTGVKYPTLAKAVAAASAGDVIKITEAGTYTVPSISKNITVAGEGDVDENGVVFNCVGSGSIASISNGATFQNVTMNFGQSGYHGFQSAGHIVMTECVLNGLFFSYGDMTFNDCTFNQDAKEYNMWTYGGDIVYNGCTFNSKGKFLNIYRESAIEYDILAKDCVFNTSGEEPNKAALNIKETCNDIFLKYNVTIENCSCNDLQNTIENKDDGTLYRVSPIWQVDDRKTGETGINVTIDGSKVYPFCSKDSEGNYHIVNAAGLLQFHDLYAAGGKVASTAKVFIENDIDFTGKTWTVCDWHADGNKKGFALFDGQNHTIKNFTVNGQGMFSRWAGGATPYFKDIVFDGAKNVTSTLNVSLFCGQCYQDAKIENVTIKNSQIEGSYKVAPFVGTVYNENPGSTATLTLKDCKVENTTVRSTNYNYCTCGMVAWVSDIDDNDKIVFEGNNVVKDVTLYKSAVSYNLFGKIYWGDGDGDGVAHDEAENVTVTNVNIVNVQ